MSSERYAGNTPRSDHDADECVFCRILRGELTPGVVAFRDTHTAVFPSRHQHPQNRGHMLVVPISHVAQIDQIDNVISGPLMMTLARATAAVRTVFSATGVSIRQNNGAHGGQDVFHLHFHVVPRFADDGFIAVGPQFGTIELSLDERVEQATRIAAALASLRK